MFKIIALIAFIIACITILYVLLGGALWIVPAAVALRLIVNYCAKMIPPNKKDSNDITNELI
jgi:predicted membrane protein